MSGPRLAIACLLVIMFGAGIAMCAHPAKAHDIYGGWRQPDNPAVSCCNGTDCRPTRAYLGEDGRWRAWDGLGWVIVPAGRVMPEDMAKDGRNHLCEQGGHIYCFSPSQPKS